MVVYQYYYGWLHKAIRGVFRITEADGITTLANMIVTNWEFWKWVFIALMIQYVGRGTFGFTKAIYLIVNIFRKRED